MKKTELIGGVSDFFDGVTQVDRYRAFDQTICHQIIAGPMLASAGWEQSRSDQSCEYST